MKNIFSKFLISFLFCLIAVNSGNSENKDDIYKKIDLFSEVLDKINKEYVEDVNQSDAMDAAINGVLQSLDPYSAYMTPSYMKVYKQKRAVNLEDWVSKLAWKQE